MAAASGDTHICTICLSHLGQNTKILPCKHEFCSHCITKYIDHQPSQTFTCPNCRSIHGKYFEHLDLPSHFETTTTKQKLTDYSCDIESIDYFCVSCDSPISVSDLICHSNHSIESVIIAAKRKQFELQTGETFLESAVKRAADALQMAHRQIMACQAKMFEVEKAINERYDTLVRVAKRYRDRALENLRLNNDTMCTKNEAEVGSHKQRLEELVRVQQKIKEALKPGNECEVFTAIKRMSSEPCKHLLNNQEQFTFLSPVLRCDATWDKIQQEVRGFIGMAEMVTITLERPEMTTEIKLDRQSVSESFVEILTLFPVDGNDAKDGSLAISYITEDEKKHEVQISGSGDLVFLQENTQFKEYQHVKRFENGNLLRPISRPGVTSSFNKSTKGSQFRLNSGYKGEGKIRRVNTSFNSPQQLKDKTVLKITCGRHRAFDVSGDGKAFVVLEEAESPAQSCNVHLYKKKSSHPVTTYQPPCQPFRPTDVCFYQLGGQHVLLVADEANDMIHVVNVEGDRLVFLRYLALGSCMLFQPIDLHVDLSNRLWVACRSGNVFALQPDSRVDAKVHAGMKAQSVLAQLQII